MIVIILRSEFPLTLKSVYVDVYVDVYVEKPIALTIFSRLKALVKAKETVLL